MIQSFFKNYWEYHCRLVSDDPTAVPDFTAEGWAPGDTTRFIGNAFKNIDKVLLFLVDALLGN